MTELRLYVARGLQEFLFEFMPNLISDMENSSAVGFSRAEGGTIVSYFAMVRSVARLSLDGSDGQRLLDLIQAIGYTFSTWCEVSGDDIFANQQRRKYSRELDGHVFAAYQTYSFTASLVDDVRVAIIQRLRESMIRIFDELSRSNLTYVRKLCEGRFESSMVYGHASRQIEHVAHTEMASQSAENTDSNYQRRVRLGNAFTLISKLRAVELKKLAILLGMPVSRRPNGQTVESDAIEVVNWADGETRIDDLIREVESILGVGACLRGDE